MMNRSSNMGGEKTTIHMHQYNPPNMALGCFIGVMVLLVIIIFFLGFSDNRLNQMLTNQNNTISAINKLAGVFGISKAIQHHKTNPIHKSGFASRQTAGSSINNISPSAYGNGNGFALNNSQFSDYGIGCSSGSCGTNGSAAQMKSQGPSYLDVMSASTDPSVAQSNQSAAQREAQLFIDMGVIAASDVMMNANQGNNQAPNRQMPMQRRNM